MRHRRNQKSSSSFTESIKDYLNMKVEYYQLAITEKISILIGKIILIFLFGILALAVLLMLGVLVYDLLLMWLGIPWLATLIELGILLLFMVILFLFRDKLIITPVANTIIRTLLDSDDDNEEEDKK